MCLNQVNNLFLDLYTNLQKEKKKKMFFGNITCITNELFFHGQSYNTVVEGLPSESFPCSHCIYYKYKCKLAFFTNPVRQRHSLQGLYHMQGIHCKTSMYCVCHRVTNNNNISCLNIYSDKSVTTLFFLCPTFLFGGHINMFFFLYLNYW